MKSLTSPVITQRDADQSGWVELFDFYFRSPIRNPHCELPALLDNLVSWWHLEEASGTRRDAWGNNHLTPTGSPGSAAGQSGNALALVEASGQHVSIPANPSLNADSPFTISAWFYLGSKGGFDRPIVAKWDGTGWDYMVFYDGTNDRFALVMGIAGGGAEELQASSYGSPSTGQWIHILAGWDGAQMWIKINNGIRDRSSRSYAMIRHTGTFSLGYNGVDYADGRIDEVAIWKRTLTEAECYFLFINPSLTLSSDIIRLCNYSQSFPFFTPKIDPEPADTQGDPATYRVWPIKREVIHAHSQFANDKLVITASNVTTDWALMFAAVDWYDTPVIIRKVSTTLAGTPTADDCVIIFSGLVDSAVITNESIQLTCSNDLGNFETTLPRENMHTNCRFNFADDMCTALPYSEENYRVGTVGALSTTTLIKSADIDDDSGSSATYGTDLVNALADGAITASSQQTSMSVSVVVDPVTDTLYSAAHGLWTDVQVQLSGTAAPGGLAFATTYYVIYVDQHTFKLSATQGGAAINITSAGTNVTCATNAGFHGYQVKTGNPNCWRMSTIDSGGDWGTQTQGYWTIPDAQAGLANPALTPYLQFDFGSAKVPKLWRISTPPDVFIELRVRLIEFFSSSDASAWKHETYFECPPVGNTAFECLIPKAASARYWRICVRSRYADTPHKTLLYKVQAFESSRHWWRFGQIRFDDSTPTTALRGLTRRIRESYSGEIVVPALPIAPISGDTFVLRRGCGRTFNDCCARLNWENFGGFTDLPTMSVIR